MLILGFSSALLFSQKKLSGILNQTNAHVSTISGTDRIIVDDATGFEHNDTILFIQMQGVEILTGVLDYGNINGFLGQPGMHEFMIIQSVNHTTQEIVFRNNLLKTYDTKGNIQIVRVAYYNSAVVTGTLTCNPWNSITKKGGVLALVIGRSLTLKADIDVSAKGFIGGSDIVGDGRCQLVAPLTSGLSYPLGFTNAGFKGEGIAIHDFSGALLAPNNVKGQGVNFTGGGGGNGRFSGGGGGSNSGAGGIGGFESDNCGAAQAGGHGGIQSESLSFPSLVDRIYLGGGGGGSTSLTGLSQPGGTGGGIVIIVTDTIIGNSHKIISNGGNGGTAVTNGGSGGGGAGGSISLSVTNYGSSPLTISAIGGNGGDNPGIFGEGGGGGGGLFYYHTAPSANVQVSIDGGAQGNFSNPPQKSGFPGDQGANKPGFKAILNGFLFNSVRSSITGDTLDWICSNVMPKLLTGTTPVGGSGSYTFKWQKSYNILVPADTIDILSSNTTNYLPDSLYSKTIYFRRIVKDNVSSLRDISKWVKIIVQTAIAGNTIGKDTTICNGQNPLPLTSIPINTSPSFGNGIYRYKWLQNLTDPNITDTLQIANGIINNQAYDPPSLTVPTYYKRYVQSGRCIDFSNTIKITVLPNIQNNSISTPDQSICNGTTFVNLTATTSPTLTGGDGIYRYKWEGNINGSGFVIAPGANTGQNYNPTELPEKIPFNDYLLRRVVYSGLHDVCSLTSNTVDLKDYSKIINNTVASASAVCYDFQPNPLVGSKSPVLTGADGIYTYSWQQSLNFTNWADTTGQTGADLQPKKLDKTTWYRRIVKSPVTGCVDSSAAVKIDVHPTILNNTISLSTGGTSQTICNSQVPLSLNGQAPSGGFGGYAYQWMYSTDNTTFTPVPTGTTLPNYSPAALTASTYFIRNVNSGACSSRSNTVPITVLPLIANNNITGTSRVCYSRLPDPVAGSSLTGGSGSYTYLWQESTEGTLWNAASGTNNSPTYQPPILFSPVKYRRTATSGLNDCCSSISNVFDIAIDPLPASPINAGPDTVIFSFENFYHMKATPLTVPGEIGTWSHLDEVKSNILDPTSHNSKIEKLVRGKNSFLWTVSKGNCDLKDSVSIELLKNFIPKAFSPNGDAWNNSFFIEGLDPEDNYLDLSIVNGAGTEVFSTTNRNGHEFINWDGKNSKGLELSEGTYYYMLKITPKTGTGTAPPQSGFIILKRY